MKLDFYSDPGHGWCAVPLEMLDRLGLVDEISHYSYIRGRFAHLEEDRDYALLVHALNVRNVPFSLRFHRTDGRSRIRSYSSYHPSTAKRNLANLRGEVL